MMVPLESVGDQLSFRGDMLLDFFLLEKMRVTSYLYVLICTRELSNNKINRET